MADLPDIERMVDDWERNAVEKAERYQRMQAQVAQISITESVAGGAVSVTVGANGIPTAISMTDAVRKMSPDEISANVLRAMQKAQSKYPQRISEIVSETVGDDPTARHIVATAEENFPEPPEEDESEAAASAREIQIGVPEEDEEPAQRPAPPRRQTPARKPDSGDDEDFGDQSFLRRD